MMSRSSGAMLLLTVVFVFTLLVSIGDQRNPHVAASSQSSSNNPSQLSTTFPNDGYRRLFHFIQVTDIHVSQYKDYERQVDLAWFINNTILQVIKPRVVIMSGDIVDSLGEGYMSSSQNLKEWRAYSDILDRTNVTKELQWLDIRGNHDNLNLASTGADNNYYRFYSVRGPKHNHSYKYIHEDGGERYAFIGIDTCMDPGSRRPFNFFGQLTNDRFDEINNLKEQVGPTNYTIYFGHHPSSVVFGTSRSGQTMRDLFSNSGPYLCGHYHTVFNLVNDMYALHDKEALELELGDFKKNRKFRVVSIDNGLMNFVDVKIKQYPIILVTNPKNALFHLPNYEPIGKIARSTHIRVLVFSDESIDDVKVKLDDGEEQVLNRIDKSNLFVLPWNSSKYAQGLHRIQVTAEDYQGRKNTVSFQFSVDGTRPAFPFLAKIILRISRQIFILGIVVLYTISVVPLLVLRLRYRADIGRNLSRERSQRLCSRLLFQLSLLSSIDRLYYPLVIFPVYVCLGPWFVGFMVNDHLSVCFLWGAYLNGSFIPGGIIFFYAALLMAVYYVPFIILLSSRVHTTYAKHFHTNPTESMVVVILRGLSLFSLVVFQLLWASWFWFSFGWTAVLLGFVPTGSLLFTAALWRMAFVLPRNLFCISKEEPRSLPTSTIYTHEIREMEDRESGPLVTPEQVKLNMKDN